MHDKVYNHFSTESNIGSRKICMDKLVFLKFFVPPATPLPPPALEMDTQDAGVTLIRSVAKPKLLRFDARSLYFAELNLVSTEFVVCIWHIFSNCGQVLSLSILFLVTWFMGKRLVLNDFFLGEGSVAEDNDAFRV